MTTSAFANKSDDIARYESYLQADPGNTLLLINLGDLYHHAGRLDDAISCYEKCLALEKENTVARGRLANLLITQQRFTEAEQALNALLRTEPNNAVLLHNLGRTYYAQHKWKPALAAFTQAQAAGLTDPRNLAYKVYSQHQGDDTKAALETAQVWLQHAPGPATEGYIALLEMDHGDMSAAYQRAQQVLTQQPDNRDAATVLGNWHLQQQEIPQAAARFTDIVQQQPNHARGWLGLGLVQLYQQHHQDAIESFGKVLQLSPNHPGTLVTLGWAKLAHQDLKGAETAFRQAITVDGNFGEAHGGLASALVLQGRNQEAEHATKIGLRLDKQNFGALFAKSIALALRGKPHSGQKIIARLLETSPEPGARPLIENIQIFARQQGLGAPFEPDHSSAERED